MRHLQKFSHLAYRSEIVENETRFVYNGFVLENFFSLT